MSAEMLHFVCDRCGNLWRAYSAKVCPACRCRTLWEFPAHAEDHAYAHSRLVIDVREKVTP